MKCPKCGYLGFETTDRCRNCQYDFSLSPLTAEPDLTLRQDSVHDLNADFELPSIRRQTDSPSAGALDLDRLFGEPEPETAERAASGGDPEHSFMTLAASPSEEAPAANVAVEPEPEESGADVSALPFDDAPLLPPRAARTPLAVRRASPEIPRNRPRTTRPVRMETPLSFEPASASFKSADASADATETVASLMQAPGLAARVGASLIDVALLAAVDAAVLFLTLRISGLQASLADLAVIPLAPFAAFLGLLAFGYLAAFTVAGGQTIGKMALNLRVIGDDGRPIDAAGGVLRAAGCMLVPVTLGLSYVPAFFSADHRALHDRLAGTRVVSE
jgi:uncharacterized RDD family membrane protein YckC